MGNKAPLMPGLTYAMLLVALLAITGCRSEPELTEEEFDKRVVALEAQVVSDYAAIRQKTIASAKRKIREWQQSPSDTPPTLDILVLSSGGQYGAFGAGLLEGWGEVKDPEMRRPTFDRVTGISTGALMAPYAMVGTDQAYKDLSAFYANPDPGWMGGSLLWSLIWGKPSLFDNAELTKTVRAAIDPPTMQAIASRSADGAALLVGATNLDVYRLQVFDLTEVAKHSDEKRFEDVMLASAAIPGLFPPVEIDGWSYGDGGVSTNLFLGLDRDLFWGNKPAPWWSDSANGKPATPKLRVRYWVVINGRLEHEAWQARKNWSVLGTRAVRQYLRSAHIHSLQRIHALCKLAERRPDSDMQAYWVAIPRGADIPVSKSGAMFDEESMRAMVELGREVGKDPKSWRTDPPTLDSEWEHAE